jgi:hypothetical protein
VGNVTFNIDMAPHCIVVMRAVAASQRANTAEKKKHAPDLCGGDCDPLMINLRRQAKLDRHAVERCRELYYVTALYPGQRSGANK